MKIKLTSLLKNVGFALMLPLVAEAAPDPNFHIYLLLGQSNMQGAAPLPAQEIFHPRVQVLQSQNCAEVSVGYGEWREHFQPLVRCNTNNGNGLGPGDTFSVTMAEAAGEAVTIGLVGGAYGGAKIEYFLKDCATYNACTPPYGAIGGAPNSGNSGGYAWVLDLAKKAQEVGVIKGIIFHHGESNSGEQTWLPRVNQYISDLRTDLGLDPAEVPFIAGELPYTGCCASSHNPLVRQIPDVVENGHWVPADGGLGDRGDQLHWNAEAVIEMGKRYAAKMLEVGDYGPVDCGTDNGTPVCCDISADDNGDGLGEQNDGEQCVVTEDTNGWHPANPDDVVLAINVGGEGEAIAYGDIWFQADNYASAGDINRTEDVVTGADGSDVYSSERFGDYSYAIPLANGDYTIQFGMVEIFQTAVGARSFDVEVEGSQLISGLDIYDSVGHDQVLFSDEFDITITDGRLDIEVISIVDNATLSSILVRKKNSGGNTSSSSSTSSSTASSSAQASSSSSDDSDPGQAPKAGFLGWLSLLFLGGFLLLRTSLVRRQPR